MCALGGDLTLPVLAIQHLFPVRGTLVTIRDTGSSRKRYFTERYTGIQITHTARVHGAAQVPTSQDERTTSQFVYLDMNSFVPNGIQKEGILFFTSF